jgi:hypothetical protein
MMPIDDLCTRVKAAFQPPALRENMACAAVFVVFLLFFIAVDTLVLQRAPAANPLPPPPEQTNSILCD